MTTPTNHTHSSLFDFAELLEPEHSQSSLEQNSSIEESQIFVSNGGEFSSHTRFSSSALSGASGLKSRNHTVRSNNNNNNNNASDSVLGPVEEESETGLATDEAVTLESAPPPPPPPPPPPSPPRPKPQTAADSILKPSSYSNTKQEQEQQQQQHLHPEDKENENFAAATESGTTHGENCDSVKSARPFSPTLHTSNQTPVGFKRYGGDHSSHPFSPTLHTSNQTPEGFRRYGSDHQFSPTVHTSNHTPVGLKKQTENFDKTSYHLEGHDNGATEHDQGTERATAWAIHLALIFFCGLVIACSLLTFTVVHTYGFVTLLLVTTVVAFCAFLACFVDSTILSQNSKLKPVRQKILSVVKATQKIIEDECQLFLRDWKEQVLMLTDGGEYDGSNDTGIRLDEDINPSTGAMLPQKRRKKSKAFKLVRPFVGLGRKLFKGKGRKKTTKNETSETPFDETPSYNPPVVGMESGELQGMASF
eukprot:jgi/Psemu1/29745/gm1.29745_g